MDLTWLRGLLLCRMPVGSTQVLLASLCPNVQLMKTALHCWKNTLIGRSLKQMQSFIHCAVGRALIVIPHPIDAASQVGVMTRWAEMILISGKRECSFAFATKEKR